MSLFLLNSFLDLTGTARGSRLDAIFNRAQVSQELVQITHHDGDHTGRMTGNIGTAEWSAPEVLRNETRYTAKVDVYRFRLQLSFSFVFSWMTSSMTLFTMPLV